jgi:hypothetical protein
VCRSRPTTARGSLRQLAGAIAEDDAGSLTLEYAVLIGCVALGGALGLMGIGLALLESFVAIRSGVLAPFP